MYVLRRYDRDPNIEWVVNTYSEVMRSKPVELNGVVAATIITSDRNAFARAQKFGWTDATREYVENTQIIEKETKSEDIKIEKPKTKTVRGRPKKKSSKNK